MCAKLRQPPYAALLLDVLVPMMLRLPDDSGAWEEAEPDDGRGARRRRRRRQ